MSLRLTPDELLVLYHFFLRYTTRHEHDPENAGEDLVLHKVSSDLCKLAALKAASSSPDYDELVSAARERVYERWQRAIDRAPSRRGKRT